MLISETLKIFLVDHQLKGSSEKTIKVYEQYINYFIDFCGDIELSDIKYKNVSDYQLYLLNRQAKGNKFNKNTTGKKLSRFTIKSYVTHVKAFLNWCFDEKYLSEKILENYKMVKTPKLIKPVMSEEDIELVLYDFGESQLQVRNKCIFLLLVDSGLRLQDVIDFKIDDFIFNSSMLRIKDGKGMKDRFVPISLETKKNMYRYLTFYRPSPDDKRVKEFFLSIL